MKHRLYYWQQKVGMTSGEASALGAVFGLFMLGLGAQFVMTTEPSFGDEIYAEVDSLFALGVARMNTVAPTAEASAAPAASPTASRARASQTVGVIDINTATAADLQRLPGIGPALAQRVVEYRESMGPFAAPEHITRVSGIGPRTLERLRPHITVGD
jgi:competence protein ComEA